jgi:uncharacterized protein YbjT (DUF2867 family)
MTPVIAVTGATGALGRRVVDRLLAAGRGPDLRLVVRDPSRLAALPADVVANPGGYADGDGFAAALRGTHTLYLVSAAEAEDRLEQHRTAVAAAAAAGVERIVYTSFVGADRAEPTFTLARHHRATEQAIAATSVRHTFLRHSMYADFVPFFATLDDDRAVIAAPAGDGRTGFVSRDDLADVAAAVLLDESTAFDGQALEVTGPEALSMTEAAAVLAEITGRPAEYRPETVEEAWASRRPSGHPDWEIEGWVTSYLAIAAGELSTVTDVVPRLTGHPARSVAEHLRAHPEDWAHLR